VGYQELFSYLDGKITLQEAVDQIKVNTRKYSKRQMTWFRKNKKIRWFSADDTSNIISFIETRIAESK
jgi:tRNA dimethylallyltransferase